MPVFELDGKRPEFEAPETGWIAPDATIIGNVIVGRDVGFWFGVVIRGDNEAIRIGSATNVQEHTVMHTDMGFPLTIGRNCTIGHKAILHGCTIGDQSLIGMGATVLNGATIGRNCLIGACALITEGKVVPDNSLVIGAPGKVVRQLDAAEIRGLLDSAVNYQQNARRFRNGLMPT